MTTAAIIVAAGRGTRAGGDVPKQWQQLAGQSVVEHSLDLFSDHPRIDEIVLVVAAQDLGFVDELNLADRATIAIGGDERSISVLAGLKETQADHVLIHDGARCCCPPDVIDRVLDALLDEDGTGHGAAPGLSITDALWRGVGGFVMETADRSAYFRAQTPQGFRTDLIRKLHHAHGTAATDDVEIARAAGLGITIVAGDERNIKITTPDDFARAEQLLRGPMDIRIGNGFDVHRFGTGDHVMLCGVAVPHTRGLQGHSDADVGLHTITDAIYGALAEGDIGRHFPPSDPQWKGAESHIFLRHAVELATARGFTINNIDCTLICELPKIGPHAEAMIAKVAEITGVEVSRISVKATTSEKLGFTGRGEGIACQATVCVVAT